MTTLTFYGGAGKVGGNKILLEDKGVKIYLDFGQGFDFGEKFFYEYLKPRAANGLEVYFEFDMMPKVPKLYSRKMLAFTDLKYQKPDIDAVFISHSHSDHIGHLSFLDEDIPVYMGHGTHRIAEIYHDVYPQLYNIGDHNKINLFKTGDKIKVKHLIIEPIHVEHSVPAAYGFIIHTSKGALIYTGDFRMHGPRSDMTQDFVKKAALSKPIAMLCEGTRMKADPEHNYTEKEVEERFCDIVKGSKGLVMAYFSMLNVDRFMSFYNAAVKSKRKVVIDVNYAYILDSLRDKLKVIPDVLKDKNIKVYFRLCKTCTFCEKDYAAWERPYMKNMITYKEISADPKKYMMHMGFYKLMELVYLKPSNADFIYSMSEHFYEGEDNEEQRTIWENWMQHFGIRFHKAHCSGHACKEDLFKAVKEINPKVLIPIHTENAEGFKEIHKNVVIPEMGKDVKL